MQPNPAVSTRVVLSGSEREPVKQAKDCGLVDPEEEAEITVHLRSRTPEGEFQKAVQEISAQPISERKYLSREELAKMRGADPADLARVEAFAKQNNLAVAALGPDSRSVTLKGKLGDLQQAFGTELRCYDEEGHQFRARSGPLYLPSEIAPSIVGVFGLDTRPAAKTR